MKYRCLKNFCGFGLHMQMPNINSEVNLSFSYFGSIIVRCNTIYMKLRLDIPSIAFTFPYKKGDNIRPYRVTKIMQWKNQKHFSTEIKRYIYLIFLLSKIIKRLSVCKYVHRK